MITAVQRPDRNVHRVGPGSGDLARKGGADCDPGKRLASGHAPKKSKEPPGNRAAPRS